MSGAFVPEHEVYRFLSDVGIKTPLHCFIEDEDGVADAASHIVRLCNARDGEGFVAVSPEARARFWAEVREGEREAEARSRPWADGSMRNASTLSTRKRIDR